MRLPPYAIATAIALSLPVQATETPYPGTYTVPTSAPVLIRDATVLIGNGERMDEADVLSHTSV